ncbi:MAG: glycosyltransferase [Nitrospirae bacterium]|nr:MAG: glycosyltransferase [Nitrospirota bacterium]
MILSRYSGISPRSDLLLIRKLCEKLAGKCFLHINSTRAGGGVAEILQRMIPILTDLGLNARWEVIEGDRRFFDITKKIHNALQGNNENFTEEMWAYHREINVRNADHLDLEADAVLIHDPQPIPLIEFRPKDSGHWIWRCHIDMSTPQEDVCRRISEYCKRYDSAIFSVARFTKVLGIPEFIIPPSIDPLSEKNRELSPAEIESVLEKYSIPRDRPMILQVSRFDRFKDPIGVIKAYHLVKRYNDCILVLAGSPATDDPEGEIVLNEVKEFASGDPDIYILLLPPYSDLEINALQRSATVVLQKSIKEGFGLTVSEAMWKGKPVIGGAVGGIPLQILNGVTGFLVHSVEGAAFRIRQFLNNPKMIERMGNVGREFVRNNFLITRQIRDYLSVWYAMDNKGSDIIEV